MSTYPHKRANADARMRIKDNMNTSITAAVGPARTTTKQVEMQIGRWMVRKSDGAERK
jgi:hypothetical protein